MDAAAQEGHLAVFELLATKGANTSRLESIVPVLWKAFCEARVEVAKLRRNPLQLREIIVEFAQAGLSRKRLRE